MNPSSEGKPIPVAGEPVFRCWTKGIRGAADQFEYGLSWVTSRRARLHVFADRLECSDWSIPFTAVEKAVLFETKQWFIPCYVLKVRTADTTYQFGLNSNAYWRGELPFPVDRQKGRLKYSVASLAIRLAVAAGLVWYFYLRQR